MDANKKYYMSHKKQRREYGREYARKRGCYKTRYALAYRVTSPDGAKTKIFESYNDMSVFFGLAPNSLRHYVASGYKPYGYEIEKIYEV